MGTPKKNIKNKFQTLTSTRRRRLIFVGAAFVFIALFFNFGYFWKQLNYQLSKLSSPESVEYVQTQQRINGDLQNPSGIDGAVEIQAQAAQQHLTASNFISPLKANEIRIESIDVHAPIVYIDDLGEKAFQGALSRGVVHFPDTALPGQTGNAYFFGHSSDYWWKDSPYRNVFALLPHIRQDEIIEVTDSDGNYFKYRVTDTFVIDPSETQVLDQGNGSRTFLTLQTSYPIGTALQRFIVRADLVRE